MRSIIQTPIGLLEISATAHGISTIALKKGRVAHLTKPSSFVSRCVKELEEYFSGQRKEFAVPLDLKGTPFQKSVWKKLLTVGFGTTLTYGELAKAIGKPRAVRAVGSAVGKNPVGVVVPCHRVVPSSGKQPGEYAWGKARKRLLLRHESKEQAFSPACRGPKARS